MKVTTTLTFLVVLFLLNFPLELFSMEKTETLNPENFENEFFAEGSLFLLLDANNPSCTTCVDGNISTSLVGGFAPYTYLWSNGEITTSLQNLPSGMYQLTVTDFFGCQGVDSVMLQSVSNVVLELEVATLGVACFGTNTGNAVAQPSGGTMPYTYLWSTGSTNNNANNLMQGNYSVTVTDFVGATAEADFTINQPDSLFVNTQVTIGCNGGNDGSVQATSGGGAFPHSFLWSTGDTTTAAENLSTGIYGLTITDANGCTATSVANLAQPIEINVNPFPNSTTCPDSEDGAINADVWGGTQPYTFLWSNGDTSQNAENLVKGTYSLTITDANGCVKETSTNVEGPSDITLNVQGTTNVDCFGGNTGAVFADAFGGTPGYTYLWDNGDVGSFVDTLAAGNYTVTITDAVGCTGTGEVIILQQEPLQSFLFGSSVCNGLADGSITATISGGTQPYNYQWSTGETTQQIENLAAGTYYLTATDDNLCTITDSITVNLNTTVLQSNPITTMTTCPQGLDGSIVTSPTGGVRPYNYLWSNGATDSMITNLTAGTYVVSISDVFSCSLVDTIVVAAPTNLAANPTVTNVNCGGTTSGSIFLNPTGGNPPYTFEWFDGSEADSLVNLGVGTYAVNIMDANQCVQQFSIEITQDNNAPTAIAQNVTISLDAVGMAMIDAAQVDNGSFDDCGIDTIFIDRTQFTCDDLGENMVVLTVIDNENEMSTTMATITVMDTLGPNVITQDATVYMNEIGLASLSAAEVDNGSTDNCGIDTMYISAEQFNCLALGDNEITLTVVDNDGNMQEGIAIVTVLDTIPPTIMCLENITQTSCDDAVAASYFIPTVNDNCPTVGPVVLTAGVPPGGILTAGTTTISYQFTDLGGNTVTCSFDYTLVTSETIEISIDSLLPASGANSDGAISISVTSGIAPFTFVWSANNLTVSTEEDPTGLSAGNYQVEITDSLGCETLFDVELLSTSTQDPTLLRKFQVYPNPTAGDLFVQLDFPVKAGNRIQVFALDGQLVLEQNLNDGEQLINLNLNRFNSGVYILKMTAEENVLTKRIVVQ